MHVDCVDSIFDFAAMPIDSSVMNDGVALTPSANRRHRHCATRSRYQPENRLNLHISLRKFRQASWIIIVIVI